MPFCAVDVPAWFARPGGVQRVLEALWQGTCWKRRSKETPGKEVGMRERLEVVLLIATVLLMLLVFYRVFMR